MIKVKHPAGFTMIELLLSMTFITALLLAIALTVIQVGTTYNKGVTVTELNQAGRSLSSDLSASLAQSGTFVMAEHYRTNSGGGRLCFGQYSYIWNYADAIESGDGQLTHYQDGSTFSFIKVSDPDRLYCEMSGAVSTNFNTTVVPDSLVAESSEMLRSGERELQIYKFNLTLSAQDAVSRQKLYTTSFTIGTGEIAAVAADRNSCRPPSDPDSNLAYCVVQQFELVIRATNGVN